MKVGIQAKKPLPECGIGLMKVVLDSFEVNSNGFMVSIYSKKFFMDVRPIQVLAKNEFLIFRKLGQPN